MYGDIIFQVYGVHEGREKDNYFGAFRTREEAQAEIGATQSEGDAWKELGRAVSQQGFRDP